jgi:hypothetical protein
MQGRAHRRFLIYLSTNLSSAVSYVKRYYLCTAKNIFSPRKKPLAAGV